MARRGLAIALAVGASIAAPGVAQAYAQVPGSYTQLTAGTKTVQSGVFRGPTGGQFRVCGDIGSSTAAKFHNTFAVRDIDYFPDQIVGQGQIYEASPRETCNFSLVSSSTNQGYYVKVDLQSAAKPGFAEAITAPYYPAQ